MLSLTSIILLILAFILLLTLSIPRKREIPTLTYFTPRHAKGTTGLKRIPLTSLTLTTFLLILTTLLALLNPTLPIPPLHTILILDTTPSMQTAQPVHIPTTPFLTTRITSTNLTETLLTILPEAEGKRVILITDEYSNIPPLIWNLITREAGEARIITTPNRVKQNIGITNAKLTPTSLELTILNTYDTEKTIRITTQQQTWNITLPPKGETTLSLPPPAKTTTYTIQPPTGFAFDDHITITPPKREALILGPTAQSLTAALTALTIPTHTSSITLPKEAEDARLIIITNPTPQAILPTTWEHITQTIREGGVLITTCTDPTLLPPSLNPYQTLTTHPTHALQTVHSTLPFPRLPPIWQGNVKPNTTILATLNSTPILTQHTLGKGIILTLLPCPDNLTYTPVLPLIIKHASTHAFTPRITNNPLSKEESLPTRKLAHLKQTKGKTPFTSLAPLLYTLILTLHLAILTSRVIRA